MSRRIDTFNIPHKITTDVSGLQDANRLIICADMTQMKTLARGKGDLPGPSSQGQYSKITVP